MKISYPFDALEPNKTYIFRHHSGDEGEIVHTQPDTKHRIIVRHTKNRLALPISSYKSGSFEEIQEI